MLPEWIVKILQSMGGEGAVIFGLASVLFGSLSANGVQYRHAMKVYGYRLTERDTLNKALTDATQVIAELQKEAEERNELTEELADLLNKQSMMLEALRQAVGHSSETARSNHGTAMESARAAATAVESMAGAIRALHTMVIENRISVAEHVSGVRQAITDSRDQLLRAIREGNEGVSRDLRNHIGTEATVVVRKRAIQNTRPTKKG